MTNDKKRKLKKNVGPAMQWAKLVRQNRSHANDRSQTRVDLDLPNEFQATAEITGGSQQARAHKPSAAGCGDTDLSSDEQSGNSSDSKGVADRASSSPQNPMAGEGRAWDFYSRPSEARTRHSQRDNNVSRSTYSKEDFYQLDDDLYFGDLSELRGTQLPRTAWSQEPAAPRESNGPGWPQYALAFVVIALLIALAVITLVL
ncbi:MAG TPA: hypothetical protein VIG82_11410 [Enteractinococcus sp.]